MKNKFLTVLILSSGFPLYAQEFGRDTTSIQEVLISENRLQIPFSEKNRNIQIISKETITLLPAKSLNEVLAYAAGVDIRQRAHFGGQADVSIDGGSFEQVLLLLNGAKISDPQTGHHSLNIPVPLDAIERIEIIRGPMARVYGANALTGAINIVTKVDESGLSLHVQGGSSFKEREELDKKGFYQGGELQIVGRQVSNSKKNMLAISGNVYNGQRYNTSGDNMKIYYQGEYDVNKQHKLDWTAGHILNQFGANGFYAAPGDRESYEKVSTTFVSVGSKHQLSESFYLSPRISNRRNTDDYRYYRHDLSKGRSEHESNVLSLELNSRLNTTIGDFGFGVEVRDEELKSSNMGNKQRENFGGYLEYQSILSSKITTNIGAYLNYNSQYGVEVYPGIDIGYKIQSDWKLNFNVGKSQRIPSFTDLYLKQVSNVGNPDLVSEKAWQYEASLQGKLLGVNLETRYFYRKINDFIDWTRSVVDAPYVSNNFGENLMQGVGLGVNQSYPLGAGDKIGVQLNYNYLIPKQKEQNNQVMSKYVIENLKHQAVLRTWYNSTKLFVSISNRYVQRELNDPYNLLDVKVGTKLNKLDVYTDVFNILDAAYHEFGTIPLASRWFNIGAKLKL